jgi:hypothetical protein
MAYYLVPRVESISEGISRAGEDIVTTQRRAGT